ncbi:hypothetical protein GCM10010492_26580 [Saccharothrix mutabilis subsp. mutabilis]|uniref:Lipoprotein n=1 Tax=Saccharothrix mutabilis subsp. mutabilis TaxID=66855 RepID=A0ABP3DBJ7_9PSEU
MKALKLGVVVAAVGLVLVGCGSEWEGDVRLKVVRIVPDPTGKAATRVGMELDESQDKAKAPHTGTYGADLDQLPKDVKVGDVVTCTVKRSDDNGFDGVDPKLSVGPCRAA